MLSDRSIEVSNDSALQLVIGRKITSRRKEFVGCQDNQDLKRDCQKVNGANSASCSKSVNEDTNSIVSEKSLIIVEDDVFL